MASRRGYGEDRWRVLSFRASPREWALIHFAAQSAGVTPLSGWIRWAAVRQAHRQIRRTRRANRDASKG
jgi:hypothetical protein